MSIHDYSLNLKAIADLLENVEAPVSDKTLVMYMLNGLNERFDHIINVIKHQKPFPTFDEAQNMLEMEKTRLKKLHKGTVVHSDNSSSSTALVSTHSEGKPGNQQLTSLVITEEINEDDVDVGATTTTTTVSLTTIGECLCLSGLVNTTGRNDLKRLG